MVSDDNGQPPLIDAPPAALWLVPMAMLLAAPLDWPYAYYQFLRVVVCVACAALAFMTWRDGRGLRPWVLIGVALIYNPLAPLSLGRPVWTVVNIATVAALAALWWAERRKPDSGSG